MNSEPQATILVVDDNPATLYATARVLRRAGFNVLESSTGRTSIELAATRAVDLVVLDIHLPDLDGYEVCRLMRASPSSRSIRIVHLSASFVDDVHKVEGYEAGADGFLTHPVDPAVLVATVNALLRTRAVEMQLEVLLHRERLVRQEAELANRAKDEFLATLSHELRSPLNAIIGWSEVARLYKPSADVLQAIEVIVRNARFQTQLITDLLDVSRITLGKLRLEREAVVLAEAVEGTVEALRANALDKSITIECVVDRSIGTISGDPVRLQQIVGNLLSNALKFSLPGGRVRVTLERDDGVAVISVSDEGRGIEPEALRYIFDRFWQDDTSSRRSHSGLGLGLAIVKHLTEMHGGRVEAASEGEGRGATFTVTIPLLPAPVRTSVYASTTHTGDADLSGLRVLIVDDDEDGRRWVKHIVADAGAEAMDVADVGRALEAVESFEPHVLVSDLAMPGYDGFDLLGFLRARGYTPASLPAIALSAYAGPEHKYRALGASFQSFLPKPPDPRELVDAVGALGAARRDRPSSGPHPARA